jgi:ZIP Zinc transporter
MIAIMVIFFVEFATTRYLAHIDEKVMRMQITEPESQHAIIQPIQHFLSNQSVVIGGKKTGINGHVASEASECGAESILTSSHALADENTPLLIEDGRSHADQQRKETRRRDSHSGHHHYDPPPINGSTCPDVTRQSQLLAVAIMEGGLCFHSIFVGLALAVATGGGFVSLFSAIMFHRMILCYLSNLPETFEGMGLGARIATISFSPRSLSPYIMGLTFATVTPLGMAIGLSIRTLYSPTSAAALITTGVFDSISAGLLIYAALVELLADEFLIGEMRFEKAEKAMFAGFCIVIGALAMSLLGLWV